MRLSICADAVFAGRDFYESLREIRAADIEAVEFWSWQNRDMDKTKALCDELGLHIAAFCVNSPGLTAPSLRNDFLSCLRETIAAAKKTGTRTLIVTAGQDIGAPRGEQHKSVVDGLKAAVFELETAGITLVLEPLNTEIDHNGHYLRSSDEAFAIVDEVGSPYVKVLFDIYHQQITEGNIINRMKSNIQKIGHVHGAGVPGRHELDTGELCYPVIFKALSETGYKGYIGIEYFPLGDPAAGLKTLVSERLKTI